MYYHFYCQVSKDNVHVYQLDVPLATQVRALGLCWSTPHLLPILCFVHAVSLSIIHPPNPTHPGPPQPPCPPHPATHTHIIPFSCMAKFLFYIFNVLLSHCTFPTNHFHFLCPKCSNMALVSLFQREKYIFMAKCQCMTLYLFYLFSY